MSTRHIIPTTPNFDRGHFSSDAVILIAGSSRSGGPGGWSVGGWNAEGEARLVFRGPMVKGPFAYVFGRAGVIDNHGGTKGEQERKAAEGLLFNVAAGDTLVIDGIEYILSLTRDGYPNLTRA